MRGAYPVKQALLNRLQTQVPVLLPGWAVEAGLPAATDIVAPRTWKTGGAVLVAKDRLPAVFVIVERLLERTPSAELGVWRCRWQCATEIYVDGVDADRVDMHLDAVTACVAEALHATGTLDAAWDLRVAAGSFREDYSAVIRTAADRLTQQARIQFQVTGADATRNIIAGQALTVTVDADRVAVDELIDQRPSEVV